MPARVTRLGEAATCAELLSTQEAMVVSSQDRESAHSSVVRVHVVEHSSI